MLSIRGGSGLGDAIYLQSVARYFIAKGHLVEACSPYAAVFRPLGERCKVSPFRRTPIDVNAHYSMRRSYAKTTQFEDCCIQAGIKEPVDLHLGWSILDEDWKRRFVVIRRPVIVVQMPRPPFARTDGYGMELLPDCRVIQRAIDALKRHGCFVVQIGQGEPLLQFDGIDLDLAGETSVSDVLDIAALASGFLGYCSFIVPLAEALKKPALLVWSRAGLNSRHDLIRTITPQKIFHGPYCRAVIDDCTDRDLTIHAEAFCDALANPQPV